MVSSRRGAWTGGAERFPHVADHAGEFTATRHSKTVDPPFQELDGEERNVLKQEG